jgi:hypothetical protein
MGKQQDREKIVQKIKVAADLYRKLPFCKIPEELKKLRLYNIHAIIGSTE